MNNTTSVIIKYSLEELFWTSWDQHQIIMFSAPCGYGKTTTANGLLSKHKVCQFNVLDAEFPTKNIPENCNVVMIDDLQYLLDSHQQKLLCDLIRSRTDLHFVLLGRGRVPGWLMPFQLVGAMIVIESPGLSFDRGTTHRMLESYDKKEDLYIATASQMFNVPIKEIDKKDPLRQKGKLTDLSCGYGGSVGALTAMGALDMGFSEEELKPLVNTWRAANPRIVSFWWAVDRAAMKAVKERTTIETQGIRFSYRSGMLFIKLPSGRELAYVKPSIGINQFGSDCVTYEGVGSTKKWERINSYGPKFVENIVQAISRDILIFAMSEISNRGYKIVMHVHDEVVIEAPTDASVEEICRLMTIPPPWAKGLNLRAEGFESEFYKKD